MRGQAYLMDETGVISGDGRGGKGIGWVSFFSSGGGFGSSFWRFGSGGTVMGE